MAAAAAAPVGVDAMDDDGFDPDDQDHMVDVDGDTSSEVSEADHGVGAVPLAIPVAVPIGHDAAGAGGGGLNPEPVVEPGDGWTAGSFSPDIKPCSVKEDLKKPHGANPHHESHLYFLSFFDQEIQDKLIFETNLYAAQMQEPECPPFEPVDRVEFRWFIADVLTMGIVKLPCRRDYWHSWLFALHSGMAIRSHNRFEEILKNLHFADNEKAPKDDRHAEKMYKVQLMFDHINKTSKSHLTAGERLAIDEQTIRSKHHSGIQQYNPNKPAKRHLKVWAMALSDGFLYHVELYGGATKEGRFKKKDKGEDGLGEKVVLKMASKLPGAWHHLTFDNYFTSPKLLRDLLDQMVYATGTLRKNRADFPKTNMIVDKHGNVVYTKAGKPKRMPVVLEDKEERGTYIVHTKDQVNCFSVKDTKVCNLASSFCDGSAAEMSRRMKDPADNRFKRVAFNTCNALVWYNKTMGYVDLSDMYRKSYGVDLKCRKWTKSVFSYFINTMRVQSYLYARRSGSKVSHRNFILEVITHLRHDLPKRKRKPSDISMARTGKRFCGEQERKRKSAGPHWPEKRDRRNACVWCRSNDTRSDASFICEHCQVYLHPACFKDYHNH